MKYEYPSLDVKINFLEPNRMLIVLMVWLLLFYQHKVSFACLLNNESEKTQIAQDSCLLYHKASKHLQTYHDVKLIIISEVDKCFYALCAL